MLRIDVEEAGNKATPTEGSTTRSSFLRHRGLVLRLNRAQKNRLNRAQKNRAPYRSLHRALHAPEGPHRIPKGYKGPSGTRKGPMGPRQSENIGESEHVGTNLKTLEKSGHVGDNLQKNQ